MNGKKDILQQQRQHLRQILDEQKKVDEESDDFSSNCSISKPNQTPYDHYSEASLKSTYSASFDSSYSLCSSSCSTEISDNTLGRGGGKYFLNSGDIVNGQDVTGDIENSDSNSPVDVIMYGPEDLSKPMKKAPPRKVVFSNIEKHISYLCEWNYCTEELLKIHDYLGHVQHHIVSYCE